MTTEIWTDAQYNGVNYGDYYEVSDHGRVRSLDGLRTTVRADGVSYTWRKTGQMMRPTPNIVNDRQKNYKLCLTIGGEQTWVLLHKLVLESFNGPAPDGMECSHLDGVGTNCRLDNLMYETHIDNCRRRVEHNTSPVGSKNPSAILDEEKVLAIRQLRGKLTNKQIGTMFGVAKSTIGDVLQRRKWQHV